MRYFLSRKENHVANRENVDKYQHFPVPTMFSDVMSNFLVINVYT